MAAKIAALIITLLLNIAVGVVGAAVLIVVMNGYGERDATWGLGVYAVLALIVAAVCSLMAYYFTGVFIKKEFSPVFAALTAVPVFSIIAVVLEFIAAFVGIGVAEIVRVNF